MHVDVRLVAATHRDLEAMREAGTFRDDLFYRIAGAEVEFPPLRERGDDIDLLMGHVAHAAARKHGTEARLTTEFLAAVRAYPEDERRSRPRRTPFGRAGCDEDRGRGTQDVSIHP